MNGNVTTLLKQRYFMQGEDWRGLCHRVSANVVDDPVFREVVFEDLVNRVWLPNSPCLVNAGRNSGLFACFVAGPGEDDLGVHLDTLSDIAHVAKKGGGCGFSGTNIRPKNSPVAGSAHGYSYGPVAWAMSVSKYLDMMTQSGFRKMALMFTLSSDHSDLDEFIDCKQSGDETQGYNFNQSIMATDWFMQQATQNPSSKQGQQLMKIAQNSWNNGEPGLLFYDTINRNTPYVEEIIATNPCGEQPLPEYGSCNLGSINIAHTDFWLNGEFNFEKLNAVTGTITRFLDLVGSKNEFPSAKFKDWYDKHRPIGVGIMGYADALLKLRVDYGSEIALRFLRRVMETIYTASRDMSIQLGKELGNAPFELKGDDYPRRNITTVSIAPTGSISFIAECSSGIEPIFMPKYFRTDERGETYEFIHAQANEPYFRSAINDDPAKVVTWQKHVMTQAACQEWVDSGVSKTINMPNDATVQDVHNAIVVAWTMGAKGITVYRDGSRQQQVLSKDLKSNPKQVLTQEPKQATITTRPKALHGTTYKVKSPAGTVFVTINEKDGEPFEVFARVGKGGSEIQAVSEAIGRLISLVLRMDIGVNKSMLVDEIVSQLIGIGGSRPIGFGKNRIMSLPDAIGQTLANHIGSSNVTTLDICPECGAASLIKEEGCTKCLSCGHSEC